MGIVVKNGQVRSTVKYPKVALVTKLRVAKVLKRSIPNFQPPIVETPSEKNDQQWNTMEVLAYGKLLYGEGDCGGSLPRDGKPW